MTRPDLADELDAVTRHLVLLTALVESLAAGVRTPQDAPADGPAPRGGPDGARGATAKTAPEALPVCTCPPCLAERERGERP